MGVAREWSDQRHLAQHLLAALAYFLLGRSVLRGRRWAWWVVVIVVGAISLLGLAGVVFTLSQPAGLRSEAIRELEQLFQFGSLTFPLFVLSVVVLAASVLVLLRKEARDALLRPQPR
ncbi:MAG: hypothetical protein L0338_22650 [Acidobacteria bacterium]|nr:hypothetical protein [Acidobacteriota bacterium]